MAIPYRKNAEENAPRRKYFIEASAEASRRKENPVRQVQGQGQDLQGQEHQDEVGRRGDEGHARRGQEDERVVLGLRLAGPVQVVIAEEDGDGRRGQDHQAEEHRVAVQGHHASEHRGRPW
jgi:hypothetical protein